MTDNYIGKCQIWLWHWNCYSIFVVVWDDFVSSLYRLFLPSLRLVESWPKIGRLHDGELMWWCARAVRVFVSVWMAWCVSKSNWTLHKSDELEREYCFFMTKTKTKNKSEFLWSTTFIGTSMLNRPLSGFAHVSQRQSLYDSFSCIPFHSADTYIWINSIDSIFVLRKRCWSSTSVCLPKTAENFPCSSWSCVCVAKCVHCADRISKHWPQSYNWRWIKYFVVISLYIFAGYNISNTTQPHSEFSYRSWNTYNYNNNDNNENIFNIRFVVWANLLTQSYLCDVEGNL